MSFPPTHTSWHRQNISIPAISHQQLLRIAAPRGPRSPKMPKTLPSWLILGLASGSGTSQKKEDSFQSSWKKILLGPKHEMNQGQSVWEATRCASPQGGAGITREVQVDRKPCRARAPMATGEQESALCRPLERQGFQLWLLGSSEVTPGATQRILPKYQPKNHFFKTIDIIRVYSRRNGANNPAACPRYAGTLSKCLQNE